MTETSFVPGSTWAFLSDAFADWSARQVVRRLGLLNLLSRGPASPLWRGVDANEIAQRLDRELALLPDANAVPRLEAYRRLNRPCSAENEA